MHDGESKRETEKRKRDLRRQMEWECLFITVMCNYITEYNNERKRERDKMSKCTWSGCSLCSLLCHLQVRLLHGFPDKQILPFCRSGQRERRERKEKKRDRGTEEVKCHGVMGWRRQIGSGRMKERAQAKDKKGKWMNGKQKKGERWMDIWNKERKRITVNRGIKTRKQYQNT